MLTVQAPPPAARHAASCPPWFRIGLRSAAIIAAAPSPTQPSSTWMTGSGPRASRRMTPPLARATKKVRAPSAISRRATGTAPRP